MRDVTLRRKYRTECAQVRAIHEFAGPNDGACIRCGRRRSDPMHDLPLDKRAQSPAEISVEMMSRSWRERPIEPQKRRRRCVVSWRRPG